MKVVLTFKTPDVVFDTLMRLKRADPHIDTAAIKQTFDKYVKFDEYLNVEFDTETLSCVVLPVKQGVTNESSDSYL